jgi:uroporphyrinogen-III synthase
MAVKTVSPKEDGRKMHERYRQAGADALELNISTFIPTDPNMTLNYISDMYVDISKRN